MNKVLDKITSKKAIQQLAILAGLLGLTLLAGGCSVSVDFQTAVPSPTVGAEPANPTPSQTATVSPTAIVVPTNSAALPSPTGVATVTTGAILSPVVSEMSATPVLVPNTSTVIVAPTPTPTPNLASPTAAQPTATTSATTLAAANPTSSSAQPNGQPDGEEQLFLSLLNQYRQANGAAPLTFDPNLYKSARWMAQDMAASPTVSHTDSLGRHISERIKAFGYTGGWVGENIAAGFEHAADNLKIWQSDDIHKNNLLGPHYTKVGVARYDSPTAHNHWSWVLDLG